MDPPPFHSSQPGEIAAGLGRPPQGGAKSRMPWRCAAESPVQLHHGAAAGHRLLLLLLAGQFVYLGMHWSTLDSHRLKTLLWNPGPQSPYFLDAGMFQAIPLSVVVCTMAITADAPAFGTDGRQRVMTLVLTLSGHHRRPLSAPAECAADMLISGHVGAVAGLI